MLNTKKCVVGCLIGLSACTPLVLAPGAAQVRVTNVAGEVSNCTAVGNLRVPKDANGLVDIGLALGQMKNQTVGLGGNVALVTEGSTSIPMAGVAYQCPAQSGSGT